jgi:hypothetical protein
MAYFFLSFYQTYQQGNLVTIINLREFLKIAKFKAQELLKPEFTVVNEDFKSLKQRRNLHFKRLP